MNSFLNINGIHVFNCIKIISIIFLMKLFNYDVESVLNNSFKLININRTL